MFQNTFGQDSIYQWLIENNALLLSLGPSLTDPHHGWVIVHHTEEIMKVPYRHFKKFDGKIYDNSKYIGKCSQEHYVRSDPQKFNDYSKVNKYLFKKRFITESNFENIIAHSVNAKDIYSVTRNLIKKNLIVFWLKFRVFSNLGSVNFTILLTGTSKSIIILKAVTGKNFSLFVKQILALCTFRKQNVIFS